jgi:hypothetical protein
MDKGTHEKMGGTMFKMMWILFQQMLAAVVLYTALAGMKGMEHRGSHRFSVVLQEEE